jgi:non-canonical (house-cleaning) NTP pyrophosphatase
LCFKKREQMKKDIRSKEQELIALCDQEEKEEMMKKEKEEAERLAQELKLKEEKEKKEKAEAERLAKELKLKEEKEKKEKAEAERLAKELKLKEEKEKKEKAEAERLAKELKLKEEKEKKEKEEAERLAKELKLKEEKEKKEKVEAERLAKEIKLKEEKEKEELRLAQELAMKLKQQQATPQQQQQQQSPHQELTVPPQRGSVYISETLKGTRSEPMKLKEKEWKSKVFGDQQVVEEEETTSSRTTTTTATTAATVALDKKSSMKKKKSVKIKDDEAEAENLMQSSPDSVQGTSSKTSSDDKLKSLSDAADDNIAKVETVPAPTTTTPPVPTTVVPTSNAASLATTTNTSTNINPRRSVDAPLRVAIGTTNPGKVKAVVAAIAKYDNIVKPVLKMSKMNMMVSSISHKGESSPPLNLADCVEAYKVPSGVCDQPITLKETLTGAKNRALNAYSRAQENNTKVTVKNVSAAANHTKNDEIDTNKGSVSIGVIGVGLESGLFQDPDENYYDVCCCAIYDGEFYHVGYSCAWQLPESVKKVLKFI